MAKSPTLLEKLSFDKGSIKIYDVNETVYSKLLKRKSDSFLKEQKGLFGIEDKIIIMQKDWFEKPKEDMFPYSGNIFSSDFCKTINSSKVKLRDFKEIDIDTSFQGESCIEISRGVFSRPKQEFEFDGFLKDEFDKYASKHCFVPLYSGKEHLTNVLSFGHHVHYSVGTSIETLLAYLLVRNDLWRINAISANSPLITKNDKIKKHNCRLANTYVRYVLPPIHKAGEHMVRKAESQGCPSKLYPLIINDMYGTLEVRASDLDPKSSAIVSYILLLIKSAEEKIENKEIDIYSNHILKNNINQAKKHGMSLEGVVYAKRGNTVKEVGLRDDMIYHFENELEPLIKKIQNKYRNKGGFFPVKHLNEIRRRIYDGDTNAQKQIDLYKKNRKKGFNHFESLADIQKVNFFNEKNY